MAEKRESVSVKHPNLSFAEVTKIIGNQWSNLPQDQKQKYLNDAESDRAEYVQKLKTYQQSSEYKDQLQKLNSNDDREGPSSRHKTSTSSSPTKIEDIPIFTEAFLDHNKAKDAELRQLRKSNAEYEEQNTILQRHIENLQNAITRLDDETHSQRQSNYQLQIKLHDMKETIVNVFKDLPLPDSGLLPTMKTVDSYMKQVHQLMQNSPTKNQKFAASVKEILSKLDLQDLLHLKT